MGIEDFDPENPRGEDSDEEAKEEDSDFPSLSKIESTVRRRAKNNSVDIEVDGDTLTGSSEDFAMVFALMFLDIEEAEPEYINQLMK